MKKQGKARGRETRTKPKRPGVLKEISAAAEDLNIYAGNSVAVDDAMEAKRAFERADRWARSTTNEEYGGNER